MLLLDCINTLASLQTFLIQELVLTLIQLSLQLKENLLAKLRVTHILSHFSELDEAFNLLLFIFDQTSYV